MIIKIASEMLTNDANVSISPTDHQQKEGANPSLCLSLTLSKYEYRKKPQKTPTTTIKELEKI